MRYILDGVNYQTLIMMLADAPRYVRRKKKARSAEDEVADILEGMRSRLS